ncbi:hypothetical protein [Streptomyces javensis]|uniref:Secreted protein n=1 Tax=Streptomyces javensis TaxID=114698 RepID=A0ABS0RDQ5_9ACTN|nr:hypothetical protein [Streptomyces javensis]MBI0315248.1 hypothetical protein [Streptomyces javensis]
MANGTAAAVQPAPTGVHFIPNPDPDGAPSARPAAGPERAGLVAASRPVSGKNPQAGPTFTQTSGVWNVDRTTTVLRNTVTDADGDKANLTFEVYTTDASGNPKDQVKLTDDNPYGALVSPYVGSGTTAEVTVPYGKLKPGTTYTFHTSAYDGSLYETTWSPWAKFRIRSRSVDIKLPEPDKNAPKVDLDAYQEPQEGRRNVPDPEPPLASPNVLPAPLGKGCTDTGNNTIHCLTMGEPGDLTKDQRAQVQKRLRTTTDADDLFEWCHNLLVGTDYFKRTEACLKKATPIHSRTYSKLPNGEIIQVGVATFASMIQMKLDPASTTFQQRFWLVPVDFKDFEGGLSEWGPLTMTPEFSCTPQCSTSAPQWTGAPTWSTTGTDWHTAYATFTHTASGTDTSNVASVQMIWKLWGTTPGTLEKWAGNLGTSTPDLDIRCDKVADPAKPGCVFSEYKPTWVMNFKKYPPAVAHAWLIQSKLPNHPGSKAAGKPMLFLPKADKNATNHDPEDNRKVICPDGWAAKSGNPDATTVPELTPNNKDSASCDEFAYAASYNSGGMPAAKGGLNEVTSGDQCVQTYATRATQGEWHLYDDIRTTAPTWKEVCGRSTMSGWINSGSMAGFPGNFSASGKFHLLDKDEYWVAFPEFAHCDASKATVTCTVPKP